MAANALASASFIRTGQVLVIPTASAVATAGRHRGDQFEHVAGDGRPVAARAASRDLLLAAAQEFDVPAGFVLAVAWQESGWQAEAVSSAGAVGLMQLMPATADWVAGSMLNEAPAITDAQWNARAGVRLLAYYPARYQGDKARTLAYLQGMGSVDSVGVLRRHSRTSTTSWPSR